VFKPRQPSAQPKIEFAQNGEALTLTLSDVGRPLPVADWVARKPDCAGALARVMSIAEDGQVGPDGEPLVRLDPAAIQLAPAIVAGFDVAIASALNLPAPTPWGLDLRPIGHIDEDRFHIEVRWVRPGGQRVRADMQGALLKGEGELRRVPDPIWSLYRAATALSSPAEKTERFQALANLRAAWPDDPFAAVDSDPFLKDLRVHYASAMSLKLVTLTPGMTEFQPVLFGSRSVVEAEEEGRGLDEEVDNVLPSAAQKIFAEQRFRREAEARPVYSLRKGEYVFIDPSLRPALAAVRQLQDRPEAERRKFILNPRRVLREMVGDERADQIGLDHLFVETEQFSERVAGVDIWRAPVLPWLVPSAQNKWLPERFGLRVGDQYFVVPPENVSALIQRLTEAESAGSGTIDVTGLLRPLEEGGPTPPTALPSSDQVGETIRGLEPFGVARPSQSTAVDGEPPPEPVRPDKLFLVVRDNFEAVEYSNLVDETSSGDAEATAYEPSRRVTTALKPHQLDGVKWLVRCAQANRRGALLADDMGLGKTLQAIAFMAWLQDEADAGRRSAAPFLIVAPTGLLGTWRAEIERHLDEPCLGPLVPAFGGNLKAMREEDSFSNKDIETGRAALSSEAWREAGVVLTTYETLRDYHFSFARTRFGLIVYDEIQKLKNPASQVTRAAEALNSAFTLGMTGTPVENRLQDLWSIMDVVTPGLLGSSRDFERRYPTTDRAALAELKSRLMGGDAQHPPYMVRRMKADALVGMPDKKIHATEVDMPKPQADAYRDLVVRAAAAAAGGTMGKGGMLSTLAAMRGVSLHPTDPRQAPADLDLYARDSARLSHTLSVLDEIAAKQEKALIFVEDLAMQERLSGLIQARFKLPVAPARINGAVPGPKRQAIVDTFQDDRNGFGVMILSPKAGGVGLTLTAANHVIHLSRWWNPAVEDQATDRVFRIGQEKDVHVYLPMAVHPDEAIRASSFDLRLNALIEGKRQLTRDLFLPPDATDGDLSELFREVSLGGEASNLADTPQEEARTADQAPEPAPPSISPISQEAEVLPAVTAAGSSSAAPRLWKRAAGAERPTAEIMAIFANKDIERVTISDPYALASGGARRAQVEFLAELSRICRRLGAINIEYAPDAQSYEDESIQRKQIGALFVRAFPRNPPKFVLTRRERRGRLVEDDFHDRSIELDIRQDGGVVRRHELTIGRGAEALFDPHKQCTVTYAPPYDGS
jgi:superfamily II DNA or RNA helicase